MIRYVFWIAFLVSILFQGVRLVANPIGDETIWTTAASTVQTESSQTFPTLDAYMHPGGPSIEGTIFFREASKVPYTEALTGFLIILNSLLIGFICMLCYVLRKDILWPITVLSLISFQSIFADSSLFFGLTPPSVIVSLSLSLLVLLTLYLYEETSIPKTSLLACWCVCAGLSAASRIDVGSVMAAAMLLILAMKYDVRKILLMAIGSSAAFCFFDPFMWFAPVTQIVGLLSAVSDHYGGAGHSSIAYYFMPLLHVASLSIVSILFGIIFVVCRKEIEPPVPPRFLVVLLISTALLSVVFLTAGSQASRYFVPLIFIWEILLPLFVFSLISRVEFSFVKTAEGQRSAQRILKLAVFAMLVCPLAVNFSLEIATKHILNLF